MSVATDISDSEMQEVEPASNMQLKKLPLTDSNEPENKPVTRARGLDQPTQADRGEE